MTAANGDRPPELTPFAAVLGPAIEARGLSLERIAAHLRARGHSISIATLSYWRTGRSIPGRMPSMRAVGALEEVLKVPRGSLAVLIPQALPEPAKATASVVDLFVQQRLADEMVRELGRGWDEGVTLIAMHACSRVDERGLLVGTTCREVLQVLRDDVDVYLVGVGYPLAGSLPDIVATAGCRGGRGLYRAEESACVQELLLPPLGAGAIHVIDYEISYAAPTPAGPVPMTYTFGATSPVREMYVEVDFAPGGLPAEVCRIEKSPAVERVRREPARPRMALHQFAFGPGKLGFEWETAGS